MKILNEKPPEWIMTGCLDKFRVNVEHTFWTYGDTIYNPGGMAIPDHIIAHEETHSGQQEAYNIDNCPEHYQKGHQSGINSGDCVAGKDAWWREYLTNPRFRLEQEAEAYGHEYRFFCDHYKDRNQRFRFLMQKGAQLSGPLYQLAVTASQARDMIAIISGEKKIKLPA